MPAKFWKITPSKALIAVCLLASTSFALWNAMYPSWADPKNPEYVGWKLGIYAMNLDHLMEAMVGDSHRDKLVIGKTQVELTKKFGYVTSLDQAAPYYKYCYDNSYLRGQQVLFLRKSNWMAVMKDGHVSALILVKGC